MGEAAKKEPGSINSTTHFVFQNKVFQVEGCHFSLAPGSKEAIFNIPMGEVVGSIKIPALCKEFGIEEESADYGLVQLALEGLPYVRRIHPGDVIPSEVLDGSASWQIDPQHEKIAKNKLSMLLVTWLVGAEGGKMDREALASLSDDEKLKERINEGFAKAGETIGIPKDQISNRFNDLVKELAYIEALRDYYADIFVIFKNLKPIQESYSTQDTQVFEEIERMRVLMKPPMAKIKEQFDKIDDQTSEILPLLKGYEKRVQTIRDGRDDLHLLTHTWDDLKAMWKNVPAERSEETKIALTVTYKFLAKNFSVSHSW